MNRKVNGTEKIKKYTETRIFFKEGLQQLRGLEKSSHPDQENVM